MALIVLALALAGCSGGGGQDESGGSGDSGSSAPETTSSTGAATTEDTAMEDTSMEETSMESTTMEDTSAQGAAPEDADGMSTALEGLEEAQSEAKGWNEDAELYAIVAQPQGNQLSVNAQGESGGGWLYSFVSESASQTLSVPYVDGEVQQAQGQDFPEQQLQRISEDTLPVDRLVDSSEAMSQTEEVQGYLEENPGAGASAGMDSGTSDEPEWIFSVPQDGMQERVPAVE